MKDKSSPYRMKSLQSPGGSEGGELLLSEKERARDVGAGRPTARPLYLQVKDQLIRRVLSGEWRPGECLPSEMKLAEEYGLSQGTVRKAIEEMATEGLVTRHAGRGTFVTSHRGDYHPARFRRFYSHSGQRIAGSQGEYIGCGRRKAGKEVATALRIEPEDEVAKIVRVRYFEERPVLLETIFLNRQQCPNAEAAFEELKPESIYLALEQIYNILIVRVDERLRARAASDAEAERLQLDAGAPVLEVERIAYSLGGDRVEYRVSVCGGDDIHYWNQAD